MKISSFSAAPVIFALSLCLSLQACRMRPESSLAEIADASTEWVLLGDTEMLGEGHRFRIALHATPSQCLQPGTPPSFQVCGSSANWEVISRVDQDKNGANTSGDRHIKVIQSTQNLSCLEAKRGHNTLWNSSCNIHNKDQWLIFHGGTIKRPSFDGKTPKAFENFPAVDIYVAKTTELGAGEAYRKFIVDGDPIMAGPGRINQRSSVHWGKMPAIQSIAIATEDDKFITGIQIDYNNGQKDFLGQCYLNGGNCQVTNKYHSQYANPYRLRGKEFLSRIEVKIPTQTENFVPIPKFFEFKNTFHVTEIKVYVKENGTEKLAMWVGPDSYPATPWRSLDEAAKGGPNPKLAHLSAKVLAGIFVSTDFARDLKGYEKNPKGGDYLKGLKPSFLVGIGGVFVDQTAYERHNIEIYGTAGNVGQVIESGSEMIGMNVDNISPRSDLKMSADDKSSAEGTIREIFTMQDTKFASVFYADQMNGAQPLSVIRLCHEGRLHGIFLRPKTVSDTADAESYGITNCKDPLIYNFAEDEYITSVWWIPRSNKFFNFNANEIGALSINTNKGDAKIHFNDIGSNDWRKGFGRDGYAIVGFHGIAIDPARSYAGRFINANFKGILGLGPVYTQIENLSEE